MKIILVVFIYIFYTLACYDTAYLYLHDLFHIPVVVVNPYKSTGV